MTKKFFFIFMILCVSSTRAEEKLPRHIVALYDSKLNADIYYTKTHQRAEVWLNHLGMIVDYLDIQKPLPSINPEETKAILTWFPSGYKISNVNAYCSWIDGYLNQGVRFIILGELGIIKKNEPTSPECTKLLSDFGIDYKGNFSENPYFFEIAQKDSRMVEFERKLLLNEGLEYQHVRATRPQSKVYLTLKRRDIPESLSDAIFTNDKGGFAMETFVNFRMAENEKVQWRLHPYYFFEEALGIKGWPKPDTTTLNGKRLFFSQIDGDGIFNLSMVDGKTYSGSIIINEILKKYPEFPVTASIIAGYLDMPQYFTEKEKSLYRDLFSLKNVEPAVHGYAHPLVWKKGTVSLEIPKYKFSPEAEIYFANQKLNDLLKSLQIPKESRTYLWTGDALPPREALQVIRQSQLLNMNGGGGRYDHVFGSYSYLFPLSRQVEDERQYYTAFPNENIFTNLWRGPYYGFADLIESFKNTESPFRIKPINLYYHYYSGERIASVHALKEILEYVRTQDITPIFASQYIEIVQDFFDITMSAVNDGFRIEHPMNGALRTIRFDHESRPVDMRRSQSVISFTKHQGNVYVTLGPGKSHLIYFLPRSLGDKN